MSNEKQQGYRVVYEGGQGEYVEKKSRFIATVRPVESEKEATDFINEMKKKYWIGAIKTINRISGARIVIVNSY